MSMAKAGAFVVLLLGLSACNEDKFGEIGYFKGNNNNRVFVLKATEQVGEDDVAERAAKLMQTNGRMTIAFVAEQGVADLTDIVTQAQDFQRANGEMLDRHELWRWWYRRSPNGEETLVDCALGGGTVCDEPL
ncbi:hypothetical protein [Roseobacter weihaiensis]|uniref:hypothetical protein n=1 Tax=Roseobacter weihaiensis TaxID=2763262 RepID=UPI001D09CBA6|nr:hypothetical protein [Roseobacter sp. H9]